MRAFAAAALAALALTAAGCGGTAGAGADAASLAPDDSLAFLSVDTSLDSSQWRALDQLTNKFPIKAKAIEMLKAQLRKDPGVDFDQEVRPAFGDEIDVAVLKTPSGRVGAVGMLQPRDPQKLDALLAKVDASNHDGTKTLHERVSGWTVIADQQDLIDAVKAASRGHSLADVRSFHDAMAAVPSDALVKTYVNGAELTKLFPQTGMFAASRSGRLSWVGLSASAHSNSIELDGASKDSAQTIGPYHPKLLADAPSDAIAFASFTGLDRSLKQLLAAPGVNFFVGGIETQLGFRLQALEPLLAGEDAVWVRPGTPIPEVALELEEKDPQAAVATFSKLARGVARLSGGSFGMRSTTAGKLPVLSLGHVSLYFAALNGRVVLTNSVAVISDVKAGGRGLGSSAAFKQAMTDAKVPAKTAGLLYVNLKAAVDVGLGYAGLAGGSVPADVRANLAPLRSLVAYGAKDGDLRRFKLVLQTR